MSSTFAGVSTIISSSRVNPSDVAVPNSDRFHAQSHYPVSLIRNYARFRHEAKRVSPRDRLGNASDRFWTGHLGGDDGRSHRHQRSVHYLGCNCGVGGIDGIRQRCGAFCGTACRARAHDAVVLLHRASLAATRSNMERAVSRYFRARFDSLAGLPQPLHMGVQERRAVLADCHSVLASEHRVVTDRGCRAAATTESFQMVGTGHIRAIVKKWSCSRLTSPRLAPPAMRRRIRSIEFFNGRSSCRTYQHSVR